MELSGKTALITGGGRGIGRACALALAGVGANVIVAARTMAQVESVAAECEKTGVRALAVTMDVASAESIEKAFARINEWGACDILVNNAGMAASAPLIKCSDELWQQLLDINLTGTFRCIRAALPTMLKRG